MHSFADAKNRTWNLSVTIADVKRVRSLLEGVDLLALTDGDPPLMARLGMDPVLLCDVVYALVEPQAREANVTDEQFGAAMGGDALEQAQAALFAELADFFRSLRRTDLTRAIEAQRELVAAAVERAEASLTSAALKSVLDEAMPAEPGKPSTSSPAPSVSTPAS